MALPPTTPVDSYSDDALVARLYDLAAQRSRGDTAADQDELARVDAMVYRRLAQAYSKDPHAATPAPRRDS